MILYKLIAVSRGRCRKHLIALLHGFLWFMANALFGRFGFVERRYKKSDLSGSDYKTVSWVLFAVFVVAFDQIYFRFGA